MLYLYQEPIFFDAAFYLLSSIRIPVRTRARPECPPFDGCVMPVRGR